MKRKFLSLFAILVAFTAVTMLSGCSNNGAERLEAALQFNVEVQNIGQGNTTFRFEVLDLEDNVLVWNVSTNETTVGDALLYLGLVSGDVSAFGLFVTEVNGIVADFGVDNTWWAFFIDGEMAMTGADATSIEQGRTYAFVLTEN